MRILHLATFLQGGAGRVVVDLVTAQRDAGHDVSVVISNTGVDAPGCANNESYLAELARAGVGVQRVDSMFSRDQGENMAVVRALCTRYPLYDPLA